MTTTKNSRDLTPTPDPVRVAKPTGVEILIDVMYGNAGQATTAIERQEARGQRSLVGSDQLPVQGTEEEEETWAKIGVTLGPVEPDSLFRDATLPPGWKKVPTDHVMWSDLVDERGRRRAAIFYKAAIYDQRADVTLLQRFTIQQVYAEDDHVPGSVAPPAQIRFEVQDCGARVFVTEPRDPGPQPPRPPRRSWSNREPPTPEESRLEEEQHTWWKHRDELERAAVDECRAWLAERGYLDFKDPTAHWD